jgi:hypothetical protein
MNDELLQEDDGVSVVETKTLDLLLTKNAFNVNRLEILLIGPPVLKAYL